MGAKKKTTTMLGRKRKRTYNTSGLRRGLASGALFNASCSSDCPQAQDLCGSEDSDEGGWTAVLRWAGRATGHTGVHGP